MKTHKAPLFIIALFTLFSCSNSYILSPEQLEDLLVDIHLAEGVALGASANFKTNEDKLDLYSTVYEKHGVDKAQFDSSMIYYSENLGDLTEIYERVFDRIVQIEKDVVSGDYTPVISNIKKEAYDRIADQDADLLPFIENELWTKLRLYHFSKEDFETGKGDQLTLDTLVNRKLEMRYTMESDSLKSAQCTLTMFYDDDKTEVKVFELPIDSTQLVKHSWLVADSPKKITLKFEAVPLNDNAIVFFKDIRLYDVSSEAHNISFF